jgi:hypothetical protein
VDASAGLSAAVQRGHMIVDAATAEAEGRERTQTEELASGDAIASFGRRGHGFSG